MERYKYPYQKCSGIYESDIWHKNWNDNVEQICFPLLIRKLEMYVFIFFTVSDVCVIRIVSWPDYGIMCYYHSIISALTL